MDVPIPQRISRYYDLYRDHEIIFSKEILRALHIDPRQIYVKCNGSQWPCIINSSSLMLARIIIGTKSGGYIAMQKLNTQVSLRFYFVEPHGKSMSFFINARVSDISDHMGSSELAIITLSFNLKPPDDFIQLIGRLLETKMNALRRKEERIAITSDSKRRLNLVKEDAIVFVQNVSRNCIVRNLSFSGAKILMMGISQFLQEKETVLRLEFDEPREIINLKGSIAQVENITGRKELVAISIKFDDDAIPISYKMHINNCLTDIRKKILNTNGSVDSKDHIRELQ